MGSAAGPTTTARRRGWLPRLASVAALTLASGVLVGCGGDSGKPTLTWYINPDSGGQDAVAA